ncbi:Translation initiation factor eIF-2B subunit delta [Arachis hypogaea]|nr:Translation initiation factor eIF-2B subunit delta [Arachis hypogaea]
MDPKFRRVGFEPDPNQSQYPLTVPPPRLLSERTAAVPVPEIGFRRQFPGDRIPIGSYNPSLALLGTSPSAASTPTSEYRDGDGEFSEDSSGWFLRSESSFAVTEFDLPAKPLENSSENCLTGSVNSKNVAGSRAGAIAGTTERMEGTAKEERNDVPSISKPVKANTTKAERRALQEAQRAAKATSKADGRAEPGKGVKQSSGKKDGPPVTSSTAADKKSGGRSWEKERKKDVPPPRMQFDDKSRVEKAKRRALVNQTEAVNRVELFRHLPQYEYGSQLPKLESKLFQIDSVHPSVFKVGLRYLAGGTSGDNARCIEMLRAFQEAIRDYSTPPEKALVRDLTAKIATLYSDIDRFINEKIILAAKVIVGHAATKVRDGDVLLIYGSSSVVEMILLYAHELGKQFRVVVVDSRPKLQSQALIRRLLAKGVDCTYTLINGVSYVMHEVTRVFLGASAVLSNGTVYSRIGTACVAMVAHAFHVPVLVCCEAYKFHERVQLDSICSNELGDPNAVATVPGRMNVNYLDNWTSEDNLQILNLMFDVTPSDYISAIVTDHGMVPPTSVPVIVREYGREHLI